MLTARQDDAEEGDGTLKRARIASSHEAGIDNGKSHISDSLRSILGTDASPRGELAEVPVAQLEALSAKVSSSHDPSDRQ